MHHAKVAASAAGIAISAGAVLPPVGVVGPNFTSGIETPYGTVAAVLGVLVVALALTGGVRGWRGGAVLTLGFGVLATPLPVLWNRFHGGLKVELFLFLVGGAVAIACGAYGAGAERARNEARASTAAPAEASTS